MKIRFLGTAAYEGVPSLFCKCEVCRESIRLGGRNIRTRSQALINDDLLIDFNADTVIHSQRYGLDWEKITACLITHAHSDHFYPEDMIMARHGYAFENQTMLHYYSDRAAYEKMLAHFNETEKQAAYMAQVATAHLITPGVPFEAGKYTVLPVRATHDPAADPVIYAITDGQKKMLYWHDSGVLSDESWETLKTFGRFDFVTMDCTAPLLEGWRKGHLSLDVDIEMKEKMIAEGMADEKTVFVVNHFSHNGKATYDSLVPIAAEKGFLVSYDGMEVEF